MEQTGQAIANEVLLIRDSYGGPVLLLEGDNDGKLFSRFLIDPDIHIIPAWGKENVIEAVTILESCENVRGFLGIVDADFGHVDGSLPDSRNIVATDDHDLEMMIVKTKAFCAVLSELGSKDKIENYLSEHGIRNDLLKKSMVVGHLRHLSLSGSLHLDFDKLKFESFVDRGSLDVDIDELIRLVCESNAIPKVRREDVHLRLLRTLEYDDWDPYQICCGHDFVTIFCIALRKVLGSLSGGDANPKKIGVHLRLAYDSSDFNRTRLYSDTKKWSEENLGFEIFE